MIEMCSKLEPRHEKRKVTLVDELDEVGEIFFVTKGSVAVGYRVNNVQKYCIKFDEKCVVGSYGVTFHQ